MNGEKTYPGVYEAKVVDNIDHTRAGRLSLQIPAVTGREIHARVPGCFGGGRTPAVGSAVWVMFQQGSPRSPVWLGSAVATPDSDFAVAMVFGAS